MHALDGPALEEQRPLVRAQLAQRYEQVWRACEPHVRPDGDALDARMIELGLRALDRLARIYRVDDPPAPTPQEPDEAQERGRLLDSVRAQLAELEARNR